MYIYTYIIPYTFTWDTKIIKLICCVGFMT